MRVFSEYARFTAALAVCCLAAASPAMAQEADWDAAKQAFESGKESGITPQTSGEKLMCLGYWAVWNGARMAEMVPAEAFDALPDALGPEHTKAQVSAFIALYGGVEDVPDAMMDSADKAEQRLTAGLEGSAEDTSAFFETLGICDVDPAG